MATALRGSGMPAGVSLDTSRSDSKNTIENLANFLEQKGYGFTNWLLDNWDRGARLGMCLEGMVILDRPYPTGLLASLRPSLRPRPIAAIWYWDSTKKATPENWVIEVEKTKYLPQIIALADELHGRYHASITIRTVPDLFYRQDDS